MSTLHLDQVIAAAVFVGARVSGLMVFCPFLGSNAIPAKVKAAMVLTLTLLIYPVYGPVQFEVRPWAWVGIALSEAVIGLVLGLAANFMMEASMMAGQVLGVQMGYSLATLFDPQTQADTPVLAEFHRLAALLIFLQFDVHHWLIRALVRSFTYLPAGTVSANFILGSALMHAAAGILLSALQIAAPALLATLVVDVSLGFLGKASPQLPVLFVGLAVKNILGLVVLIGVVGCWPHYLSQRFAASIALAERLLHLAR